MRTSRRPQGPVGRLRRHARGEGGFTLLELVGVVAIMGIFGIVIAESLQAFTRTTAATENKNQALADVRLATENIARDLRAANPIDAVQAPLTVASYANRISFTVYCATVGDNGCSSGHLRKVTYEVTGNALVQTVGARSRKLLLPSPAMTGVPVAQRPGAVLNTAAQPVFTYYTQKGTPLPTTGGTPATTFRNCTKTVRIHLVVMAEANRPATSVNLITSVDLRNSNEVTNCP